MTLRDRILAAGACWVREHFPFPTRAERRLPFGPRPPSAVLEALCAWCVEVGIPAAWRRDDVVEMPFLLRSVAVYIDVEPLGFASPTASRSQRARRRDREQARARARDRRRAAPPDPQVAWATQEIPTPMSAQAFADAGFAPAPIPPLPAGPSHVTYVLEPSGQQHDPFRLGRDARELAAWATEPEDAGMCIHLPADWELVEYVLQERARRCLAHDDCLACHELGRACFAETHAKAFNAMRWISEGASPGPQPSLPG